MIGIFDSGLGGLTVARAVMKKLPNWPIIYFGDTARTPYGNKGGETVKRYAIEDVEFLLKKGARVIVVGCNTVSALTADVLRKKFHLPIFDVVRPAVEKAARLTKNGRIGIIGTRATIGSRVYDKKLKTQNSKLKTFSQSCPLLVPLIEEGWGKEPETKSILNKYLEPLRKKNIDTLILGCTHYPLIKRQIQEVMGNKVRLVDSAEAVADEVVQKISKIPLSSPFEKGGLRGIYVSDRTPHFQAVAEQWLGTKIHLYIKSLS